jgi:hypothetical protein
MARDKEAHLIAIMAVALVVFEVLLLQVGIVVYYWAKTKFT